MGLYCFPTGEIVFDNCRVPKENIIMDPGSGYQTMMRELAIARTTVAMAATGICQAAVDAAIRYAQQRFQFGRPIGSFQAIQHQCANMAMDVEAAKVNTYHAAWLLSEGLPGSKTVSAAKAFVGEAFRRVGLLGHQIHGAIGFTKELDLELYIRRCKAAEVAFGNDNFHKKCLAEEIVKSI